MTFEVSTRDANPGKVGNAEIYNGNVVELFVCTTAKPAQLPRPYYEFEVSPYNQELQVLIDKDGKFHEQWKTAGFKHSVTFRKTVRVGMRRWKSRSRIWVGTVIRPPWSGNAFAIVGAKGVRRFYSAYLPPQQKPNFPSASILQTVPAKRCGFGAGSLPVELAGR